MPRRLSSVIAAVMVAVAGLSGCDQGPCPSGCPAGEICDAGAGVCVPPVSDCTVVGCPRADEECDPITKTCVPLRDCLREGCPDGQVCNARTKACQQRQGCRVDGCPEGLDCDLTTGECRPPGCRRDDDCKPGRICDGASAQCIDGCRGEDRCPLGSVCSLAPEAAAEGIVGGCVAGCRRSEDCPFGQDCVAGQPGSLADLCVEEPACERGDDCRPDERCQQGRCVRGPCTEGIACPARAYCDPETGQCLAADCSDDLFEDNDGPDAARRLLPQAYAHLRACPGDEDWYLVEADAGAVLEASIRFDPAAGDLDLEAYDPDLYRLGASRGLGNPEQVTVTVGEERAALLRVLGVRGAQAQYFLEIAVVTAATCLDDDREDNDDFRTPAPLSPGAYDELKLCPGDEDWFVVALEEGDGLEVALTSASAVSVGDGTPSLERYGPDGVRQVATPGGTGRQLRLQRAEGPGAHLLRVGAEGSDPGGYALDVRTHPGGLPCRDDEFEDNDEPGEAAPMVGRTYSSLMACPGEDDWYAITLERPGAVVSVTLEGDPDVPMPSMTLFGTDGAVAPLGDDPRRATTPPSERPGEALVLVRPSADAPPTSYDLSVEIVPGPAPCEDDALEPAEGNDGAARAVVLRPGARSSLMLCPDSPEDWYAVDVAQGGAVRLRVDGVGVGCALRTTDGARQLQACQGEDSGPVTAAAVELDRGRYRLRVHGDPPGEGLEYRLELEVLP